MPESMAKYQSYVVRLWHDSRHVLWRASAQSIQTHEISHFADLDSLFTFLMAQTIHPQADDRVPGRKEDAQCRQ
ncbi:MAG: hypothetical protein U0350_37415 [Caldilineaceae bacterium]